MKKIFEFIAVGFLFYGLAFVLMALVVIFI